MPRDIPFDKPELQYYGVRAVQTGGPYDGYFRVISKITGKLANRCYFELEEIAYEEAEYLEKMLERQFERLVLEN